jgi:hypothetical protein
MVMETAMMRRVELLSGSMSANSTICLRLCSTPSRPAPAKGDGPSPGAQLVGGQWRARKGQLTSQKRKGHGDVDGRSLPQSPKSPGVMQPSRIASSYQASVAKGCGLSRRLSTQTSSGGLRREKGRPALKTPTRYPASSPALHRAKRRPWSGNLFEHDGRGMLPLYVRTYSRLPMCAGSLVRIAKKMK